MRSLIFLVLGAAWAVAGGAFAAGPAVAETVEVAEVWAGHPVGFSLLTDGKAGTQYVAFYDKERRMTVGARRVEAKEWTLVRLDGREGVKGNWDPGRVGWDSHNSVTMALDAAGQLHVSGNMHCHPLVYFRTEKAGDVTSLKWVGRMVGAREEKCTYPRFLTGPGGELIFAYRDGRSGNGVDLYNVYDVASKTWKRLVETPLLDGRGTCNAYSHGPVKGPDGFYHLCWVWRNTPDCSTNHDVSYARSRDLVRWETSGGKALALPITPATGEVVDPVPPKGGAINGQVKIGFDGAGRVVLSYIKYDRDGKTQLYNARRDAEGWRIVQASKWDYRWDFSGGGSIVFEVGGGPVRVVEGGRLAQTYAHKTLGGGGWYLDEKTLLPAGAYKAPPRWPAGLGKAESSFPGMGVHLREDLGASGEAGVEYVMRWETLGANRDRPRAGELPAPSMLRVYKVRAE